MMTMNSSTPVAVIGSGTMGAGIAQVAASAGHPVWLYDINPQALDKGIAGIRKLLEGKVAKGRMAQSECDAILGRIRPATSLANLADVGLVIEAAVEKLEIKQQLFRELSGICSPQTLLTTNTSSISITAIGAGLDNPQRIAGLHFFNPAPVMKLVEIVRGLETDDATVATLNALVQAWGKTPVVCHSTPGFIVNRVARAYYAEAWRALEEQVAPPEVIDAALRDAGGFPMGPLALTDLIGQDVNFAVTCSVFNAFWQERRFLPSLLQQELVLGQRLGKKSGRGVYSWPLDQGVLPVAAVQPSEAAAQVVRRAGHGLWPANFAALCGNLPESDAVTDRLWIELDDVLLIASEGESASELASHYGRPVVVFDLALDYGQAPLVVVAAAGNNTPQQTAKALHFFQQRDRQVLVVSDYPGLLVARTVAMLVNEALDALQKGVAGEQDIDTAMRLGVNYPRGPLAWGAELGWQRILTLLENLQRHYGEERYRPCSLLRQRALLESTNEQ